MKAPSDLDPERFRCLLLFEMVSGCLMPTKIQSGILVRKPYHNPWLVRQTVTMIHRLG
jgi:hypothetical protein